MSHLSCENLTWAASGRTIIKDLTLSLEKGQLTGLIGPNGSGKTSLLSLLGGLRKPKAGRIYLDGQPLSVIPRRSFAQQLAFVSQHNHALEKIDVTWVVGLGRIPHVSALSPYSSRDEKIVARSLEMVGLTGFERRRWADLSGGEQQRVQLARALAQEPSILLLDEPTNHLDIHNQLNLLALISELNLTVIAALHDLNHAAMFCDRVVLLQEGSIQADGAVRDVLTQDRIASVFGVNCTIEDAAGGSCHIRFDRPSARKFGTGLDVP